MHQAGRPTSMLTLVQFEFGRTPERLFVRLDSDRRLADLLADGYLFSFRFLQSAGVRFIVRAVGGQAIGAFWERAAEGRAWTERGPGGSTVAAGTILEAALPLAGLVSGAYARVAFVVVSAPDESEIETHLEHHPIEAAVPAGQFEARHGIA